MDDAPNCDGTSTPEIVYRLLAPADGYLFAEVQMADGSGSSGFELRVSEGNCWARTAVNSPPAQPSRR